MALGARDMVSAITLQVEPSNIEEGQSQSGLWLTELCTKLCAGKSWCRGRAGSRAISAPLLAAWQQLLQEREVYFSSQFQGEQSILSETHMAAEVAHSVTSEACSTAYSYLGRAGSRDRSESSARLYPSWPAASDLYPLMRRFFPKGPQPPEHSAISWGLSD